MKVIMLFIQLQEPTWYQIVGNILLF